MNFPNIWAQNNNILNKDYSVLIVDPQLSGILSKIGLDSSYVLAPKDFFEGGHDF